MKWIKASDGLPDPFDYSIIIRDIKTKQIETEYRYVVDKPQYYEWLDETPDESTPAQTEGVQEIVDAAELIKAKEWWAKMSVDERQTVRWVLGDPDGCMSDYAYVFAWKKSNNETSFEGLLSKLKAIPPNTVKQYCDAKVPEILKIKESIFSEFDEGITIRDVLTDAFLAGASWQAALSRSSSVPGAIDDFIHWATTNGWTYYKEQKLWEKNFISSSTTELYNLFINSNK